MKINLNFIPQNTALKGVKNIGLYDSRGNKLKTIPLGNLAPKSTGNILYTFGALSDVHLPYNTGPEDFARALNYFNNIEKVNFICISGDMGSTGVDSEWANFKAHVDAHSPNTPVHISAGNHDAGQSAHKTHDYPIPYTGNPLYYSFTQGDDVFIMFGLTFWGNPPFSKESLQWLYETLEENRNKRCFVFQHMMRKGHAGDASGRYTFDGLNNTNGKVFLSLMEHYKNVLWFHGHSHCEFEQQDTLALPNSNYDRAFGCHSIHIPSCCMTRNESNSYDYEDSEGYVVDVYENGIHLRGRDFIAEKFLPIASYWIDTTIEEIEEKTYVDSRGVIDTGSDTPSDDIVIFDKSEIGLNERFSSNHGKVVEAGGVICINTPVEPNTTYKITYSGAKTDIRGTYDKLYFVSSVGAISYTNGASNISEMTEGVVYNTDYTGVEVTFTTEADTANIWFSILFNPSGTYISNADELTDVVLTLEKINNSNDGITLPENSEIVINKRFSGSNNAIVNGKKPGIFSVIAPIEDADGSSEFILKIENLPIPITKKWEPSLSIDNHSLYLLNENKQDARDVKGQLPTEGIGCIIGDLPDSMVTDNGTSAEIKFVPAEDRKYAALTIRVNETGVAITEDDIKDIIITLVKPSSEITLPENSELHLNQRYSKSGGGLIERIGAFTIFVPIETDGTKTYSLKFENLITTIKHTNSLLYVLDSNKSNPTTVNGNCDFGAMTEGSVIESENRKTAAVTLTPPANSAYLAISVIVNTESIAISEENIKNYIITLEKVPNGEITLPEGTTYTLNARDSYSGKVTKIEAGMIRFYIPCEADTTYKLSVENLPIGIYSQTDAGNTASLFCWNANKTDVSYIQGGGSSSIRDLMSAGLITVTNNDKSFSMNLTTSVNAGYIALSLVISTTKDITEEDIKDIIITLEPYTNLLPLSVDADGNDFVGTNGEDGYITGYRIRSNGEMAAESTTCATGFIPVEKNDIISIANITRIGNDTNERIALYDSSKVFIKALKFVGDTINKENAYIFKASAQGYIRFSASIISEESIVTIKELTNSGELITNVLHLAVNKDGSDFVGNNGEDGYKTGYRINENGEEEENVEACASGFISITHSKEIRIHGVTQWNLSETNGWIDRIACYNDSKEFIGSTTLMKTNGGITMEDDNTTYRFSSNYWFAGVAFIRFSTGIIDENTIVTLDEPIIIDTIID